MLCWRAVFEIVTDFTSNIEKKFLVENDLRPKNKIQVGKL